MHCKNYLAGIFLLTLLLFNSTYSMAQAGNAAYVNVEKVLQASPGYQDSLKKLDNLRVMYQNQYNYLLADLQQKIKAYEIRKDSFSPFVAQIKIKEIKNAQANLDTFQAVANSALQMQQNQIVAGFLANIKTVSEEIGQRKKLSGVWDSALLKNALYIDPKSDITEEVIQAIISRKK